MQLLLNLCILGTTSQMDLLQFMMKVDIKYYLQLKNMILFTTGLYILRE